MGIATYNWAYKPGITNKYGFTVPAGADTARPTGWCYVALFGNDTTGNGSRNYPYKTLTKVFSLGINPIKVVLGSGVYREDAAWTSQLIGLTLIGDGDVIIDISFNGALSTNGLGAFNMYNIRVKGNGTSAVGGAGSENSMPNIYTDIFFDGSFIVETLGAQNCAQLINCVIANFSGSLEMGSNSDGPTAITNCTFYNCNNIRFTPSTNPASLPTTSSVFYNCNISGVTVQLLGTMRYCLFFQTNFKMTANLGTGGVLYPSVPAGYTYYSTIAALQAAYSALFSALSFTGCIIADPLFNNVNIGDYSLSFSSPAKNVSYKGSYVGAYSIGVNQSVLTDDFDTDFENDSAVNITIADDSLTLTDSGINGSIIQKPTINENERELNKVLVLGINADRNGQYIDSTPDLATIVKNPGDTLDATTPYLVEVGAITANSNVYQPGDRYVTPAVSPGSFTTSSSGVLREIIEAPERHNVEMRFSDGGAIANPGDTLSTNARYLSQGVTTYNGHTYADGERIKATVGGTFSGTGTLMLLFEDTDPWFYFEIGIQPTTNNVGNLRTGDIVLGNGDKDFDRANQFPISKKYIQVRYTLQANNLKP